MNSISRLFCIALVLLGPAFPQVSQSAPAASDNLGGASRRVETPFKLYRGYIIVVQGSVGSLRRLNFAIDTAAYPTIVDPRITERLKVRLPGGSRSLALFSGVADAKKVVLPSLQLGPLEAKSLPVVTHDLTPLGENLGIRLDALVGLDVLSLSSFSIDYRAKKIVFGPVEWSPFSVPFDTVPVSVAPVLTVQLSVQDEPLRLVIDTGSPELILFSCQLRDHLHQPPVSGSLRQILDGAGELSVLTEMSLSRVHLGTMDLPLREALVDEGEANCRLPFDGVLGVAHLGLRWVAFDFAHWAFSWQR